MTDGLKAHHRAAIIATLAANHRVEQAVLFGSRAMGAHTVTSDVDIALFGRQLTLTDQAKLAAACEELPMAQSVDLVLHSTIDNPALVEHICSHGVEWYRRGGGHECKWHEVGISAVATVTIGGTPSRKISEYWHGSISWATAKDVANAGSRYLHETQESITDVGLENSSAKVIPKGTIVITSRGTVGALVQLGKEMAFNQTCYAIQPGDGIDNDFLYYALIGTRPLLSSLTYGTIFQTITTKSFSEWRIPLPPLPEQKAIAHILGILDDKIELNRQMNETLEAMAKALFKSWFVDFDPVRAKAEGRSTGLPDEIGALFPDSFEDSELGEIPRGWGVKRLEEYLELAYGKSLPAKSRRPGSVPVYGSGGVVGSHDVALTKGPTVIVGRKGTVGSLYLEAKPAFPIDTVFHILPRIGSMLFCYHLLACQPLSDMNTDAAVPGLNRGNVYRLEFPCPPSDLISVFDDMVGSLWKRQGASLDESDALAQVRDLLLPKLIGGELQVKDSEDFVGASV
ncbi:MAG: restriction endonuclease subunit S [Cyanobacteria bacterium MAG IRC4_bin_6]|nr:restriction endonuclease subunit S [Cyanobacteria bacterium MAG IRC3_bin_20]MDE0646853.1 restriction endonuclease subunit S [Cyanobacteria bacterium MAG IRC4_bin_6]